MKQLIAAAALAAGTVIAATGAGVAQAGEAAVDTVFIEFTTIGGDDPGAAAAALTIELFESDGTNVTALCNQSSSTPIDDRGRETAFCRNLGPDKTFTIGGADLGDYVVLSSECETFGGVGADQEKEFDEAGATFTHSAGQTHSCEIVLIPTPQLIVDVTVGGGTATTADFEIEVYDTDGGDVFATATDASANRCDPDAPAAAECGLLDLDVGTYFLGATEVPGYELILQSCSDVNGPGVVTKQFEGAGAQFTHGINGRATYCEFTMQFVTQTVSADIDVVNDNGGTATGADFTIEIFDSSDTIVASGVDPEPGSGNASFEATLPVGDYTFGVEGPEGYDVSVVATAFDPTPLALKEIDGTEAQFTLAGNQSITAVITADDIVVAPTTTVPATTTPADTMPPVTTAPTTPPTTIEPVAVLPATGSTSSNMALLALTFLLLGSTAVLATRRA